MTFRTPPLTIALRRRLETVAETASPRAPATGGHGVGAERVASAGGMPRSGRLAVPGTAHALSTRRPLNTLVGLPHSPVSELREALADTPAWRAAWKSGALGQDGRWSPALSRLAELEQRVGSQLRDWSPASHVPPLARRERDQLVAVQDLLWAMRDGQGLMAWAATRGPATPRQLAAHFGMDDNDAADGPVHPGAASLDGEERMALSLYSVSTAVHMAREPVLASAFHFINAALRHDQPELRWAARALFGPLANGLARLARPRAGPVLRGLSLPGPDALDSLRERMTAGAEITTRGLWTGSQVAPYPAHVVMTIHPLEDEAATHARDTAPFSYAHGQQEVTFVPGARLRVESAQVFPPHAKAESGLLLSDRVAASSGRSWSQFADQPLLALTLREVAADADGGPKQLR